MKPKFALSLSFDGLSLLQRSGAFWTILGQVDLADPHFDQRMSELREHALDVSPHSDIVKLVIPKEQVKFITLSMSSAFNDENIDTVIREEVERNTPYDLYDVAIDWVATKDTIFIAVVARETLHEAEEFAYKQGFKPLGNITASKFPDFLGEAHFGLADGSYSTLDVDNETFHVSASALDYISVEAQRMFDAERDEVDASPSDIQMRASAESRVLANPRVITGTQQDGTLEAVKLTASSVLLSEAAQIVPPEFEEPPRETTKIANLSPTLAEEAYSLHDEETALSVLSTRAGLKAVGQYFDTRQRLLRVGYIPIFLLVALFAVMSVTTFYLFGRTTIRNVAEKVAGPPSGPALASKLANLDTKALDATDHILKFTLPDHASYEKQRAKKQASLENVPEQVSSNILTYVSNPIRPSVSQHSPTIEKRAVEQDDAPLFAALSFARSQYATTPYQSLVAPPAVESLSFLYRDLEQYYLKTGVWALNPKQPRRVSALSNKFDVTKTSNPTPTRRPLAFLEYIEASFEGPEFDLEAPVTLTQQNFVSLRTSETPLDRELQALTARPTPENTDPLQALLSTQTSGALISRPAFPELPNSPTGPETGSIELAALSNRPIGNPLTQPSITEGVASPSIPIIEVRPSIDDEQQLPATDPMPRPQARPSGVAPIEEASLSELVLEHSLRPQKRPAGLSPITTARVQTRVLSAEEEGDEAAVSQSAQASSATRAGTRATIARALDLKQVNLLGVFTRNGRKTALIRLKNGQRKIVQVGDRLDGGRVAAIGKTEVQYVKRGRNITLSLPKG